MKELNLRTPSALAVGVCQNAFRLFCKSVDIDPSSSALVKLEKTARKYPPEMVFSERDNYIRWKQKLKGNP
jgi:hypothetical protein